jgi:hypothetical protein
MRQADPPVCYLVGTPKGRLGKLEQQLLALPWQAMREGVDVKLLPQAQELYVLAQSRSRIHKERALRQRQLKRLWARLKQLSAMRLKRAAWRLIDIELAAQGAAFGFALLTPRAILDKLAVVQMLDVHLPTTDGRALILSRYG